MRQVVIAFLFCQMILIFGIANTARAADSNSPVKILWQKEFAPDPNLGEPLYNTALSKKDDGLLLIDISSLLEIPSKSSGYINLKFWLRQITPDGRISENIILKDIALEQDSASKRFYSSTRDTSKFIKDFTVGSDGNIYALIRSGMRMLSILKADIEGKNISVKPLAMEGEKMSLFSSCTIRTCPDNSLFLFGGEKDHPIVMKLDSELDHIWKKTYNIQGRTNEEFREILPVPNKDGFIIAGISQNSGFFQFGEVCDGFVLVLDGDGNILQKTKFTAMPPSQHTSAPKMCKLDSGAIVVANNLSCYDQEPNIVITAYTPDLKLLWEKRMNKPLGLYTTFWIERISGNRFIVMTEYRDWLRSDYDRSGAVKTDNTLGLYIFDSNGTASGSAVIDKGDFSPRRLDSTKNLLYITGYTTGETLSRRIKIMALQIN